MGVNGAAGKLALLQCWAMGSTTDIQLLNSLYRIAKYVGFYMSFKCTNFNINKNVFKDYIPYSDSCVTKRPFSQFGTTTRNMQQIWLPCIVLMNTGVFSNIWDICGSRPWWYLYITRPTLYTYTLLTERTQSKLNSGSLWALLLTLYFFYFLRSDINFGAVSMHS